MKNQQAFEQAQMCNVFVLGANAICPCMYSSREPSFCYQCQIEPTAESLGMPRCLGKARRIPASHNHRQATIQVFVNTSLTGSYLPDVSCTETDAEELPGVVNDPAA